MMQHHHSNIIILTPPTQHLCLEEAGMWCLTITKSLHDFQKYIQHRTSTYNYQVPRHPYKTK